MFPRNILVTASVGAVLAGAGLVGVRSLHGSGSDWRTPLPRPTFPAQEKKQAAELYEQGVKAARDQDYAAALKSFIKADEKDANNPDILNMMAFTQRKSGMLKDAFANYERALALRPKFPQAREYLGEAHLQAALAELETLKSYGPEGQEEYDDLAAALKTAAARP